MMIYWVTYVVSGLLIEWVPLAGLWSIRVIVLAAALNPKIDWKNLIYHRGFDGEYPQAEEVIDLGKALVREVVAWLKTVE